MSAYSLEWSGCPGNRATGLPQIRTWQSPVRLLSLWSLDGRFHPDPVRGVPRVPGCCLRQGPPGLPQQRTHGANGRRFDPDSTRAPSHYDNDQLDLQLCKFCRCTGQDSTPDGGFGQTIVDAATVATLQPALRQPPEWAVWAPGDGAVDSVGVTERLVEGARTHGVRVHLDPPVTAVRRTRRAGSPGVRRPRHPSPVQRWCWRPELPLPAGRAARRRWPCRARG
ncbi:FAD-dependent oxidoreductase [Streptomyces sp. NBC_01373]|uniref:FAD-dependent oxidoreductase n=1 Tax=Streptomyces sp. NBC_01373 TaxID=2903843 RepID=UPI00338DEFBA